MIKFTILSYVGKWMADTYDVVEIQMQEDASGEPAFDPYKLLHLKNNGEFNTTLIYHEYERLANKYHPDVVRAKNKAAEGTKKIPMDKARKRWKNLNKAMDTLTDPEMFAEYKRWGDPDGSKTIFAIRLAWPSALFSEDFASMWITWGVVGGLMLPLFFMV